MSLIAILTAVVALGVQTQDSGAERQRNANWVFLATAGDAATYLSPESVEPAESYQRVMRRAETLTVVKTTRPNGVAAQTTSWVVECEPLMVRQDYWRFFDEAGGLHSGNFTNHRFFEPAEPGTVSGAVADAVCGETPNVIVEGMPAAVVDARARLNR